MRKFLKWTFIVLLFLVASLLLTVEIRQHRKFDAPYPDIKATTDSAVIAKGRNLVSGAAHCASCHASKDNGQFNNDSGDPPLSGGNRFDLPIGDIYAPNLTPDSTGIALKSDEELARALRYGVRPDGTSMFDFMPFHDMSDEDMTAVISYLRQQPPVSNKVPKLKLTLLGKIVASFLLKPVGPSGDVLKSIKMDTTVEYGRYLASNIANCKGCHTNRDLMTGAFIGEPFAGGFKMTTNTDSGNFSITTPNLTPDPSGRITNWSQEQFIARFRAGRVFELSHMPWETFSHMSDDELKAIYKFLKTVKPVNNPVSSAPVKED